MPTSFRWLHRPRRVEICGRHGPNRWRFVGWTEVSFETSQGKNAPQAGLEPATLRLTAGCSTIELLWNILDQSLWELSPPPTRINILKVSRKVNGTSINERQHQRTTTYSATYYCSSGMGFLNAILILYRRSQLFTA